MSAFLKKRAWLVIFVVVSIILWAIPIFMGYGDPIDKFGDPEWFGMFPGLEYNYNLIRWGMFANAFVIVALIAFLGINTLGTGPTMSMLAVALFIAFFFEDIGIRTGLVFGPYFHTSIEGPKLGTVPVIVIVAWAMIVYVGWIMSNLILDGQPSPKDHSVPRILIGAFLGALVATTMDLAADPMAVANGFWVWYEGGTYLGVPIHNYVGWVVLCILTLLVHGFDFRQWEKDGQMLDVNTLPKWKRALTIIPVLYFGSILLAAIPINLEGFVGLVVFFAVGIPFTIGLWNWVKWFRDTNEAEAKAAPAAVTA